MSYIDFHTHAFPDKLAASTIPALEKEGNVTAALDGTLTALLESMDRAEIDISVLCNIATRPEQFDSILSWCHKKRSDRIIPFPSFHPESTSALQQINEIHACGFKGVKMHPFYQRFYLNEDRLSPFFAKIEELGLILIMHTGYDIGFPKERRADPAQILAITRKFPDLKFIATHLGAWDQWEEVQEILAGGNVYMDIAFSLEFMEPQKAKEIIEAHPDDKILFGSDSPWSDQLETIHLLKKLGLGEKKEMAILRGNAEKLLNSY
ncbi:MAG: amidohydrolase family protein [Desulfobulbaceae bacterium]|uniref:Amidohydrolase family protein n=1 Tax=Candidatus Desulfobia pelagia TaxID=2841692 RepID=A0A8J6NAN8_9BACT|nr:amidohydrolase family protein [Candidatus Desulfobia pelagia]